jgi:mono/diheme cytochrome c family protein
VPREAAPDRDIEPLVLPDRGLNCNEIGKFQTMLKVLRAGVVACASMAAESAVAQDQALVAAGAEVYTTHCAECHGERLVNPGSSFDLRKLGVGERARFDISVTEGKGQMPAWGGVLDAKEMDQLWAYIRSKAD